MADQSELKRTKPQRPTRFDHLERERIRFAILAYARENRIGAPNLQLRIADATKRSVDQIPLKTLQRFLKDQGRTNDGFVIPLAEFVEVVGASSAHDVLARELGEFFSTEATDKPAEATPERFVGEYEVWAGGTKFIDFKVKREGEIVNPNVPYGRCRVSGSGRGLKAHETETGPGSGGADGEFRPAANEGVVLFFNPLVFMLLKSKLTRLPRVYWLRERGEGRLTGHAMHAIRLGPHAANAPYSELRNYELRPVAKRAS